MRVFSTGTESFSFSQESGNWCPSLTVTILHAFVINRAFTRPILFTYCGSCTELEAKAKKTQLRHTHVFVVVLHTHKHSSYTFKQQTWVSGQCLAVSHGATDKL